MRPPNPGNPIQGFPAMIAAYGGEAGVRDELLGPEGKPRAHWARFLESMAELGGEGLDRAWTECRRILRENGVTYNVYSDPRGRDRPWELDPVPLLLDSEDWASIDAGVRQRARLLDLVLADLYGPQRLLREGVIPPEVVFANPAFLRPMHGLQLPASNYLYLSAADVVRLQDGSWRVLSHRTQAPSGTGYALENRVVLSRTLGDQLRDCHVRRLGPFFQELREALSRFSPRAVDNPLIVLLTPGPENETYFEHAYLARYLGVTLVEGEDLTVRDNRVYLKTLSGLQRVDVILRRLDDDWCDPLQLRGESTLGVAGLVQAVAAGQVMVANGLGSGLAETPALLEFLPGACRLLLGEDLRIPCAESFWLGREESLRRLLDNPAGFVVKPAFPAARRSVIFLDRLDEDDRRGVLAKVAAAPHRWVAQPELPISTAPVLTPDGLRARRCVIRTFAGLTPGGDYALMPGGLARVTSERNPYVVSMQVGGGSKDLWVLATAPVIAPVLTHPSLQPVELSRGGADLSSRVADNLFWLGRYMERADAGTRVLRLALGRALDESGETRTPELPAVVQAVREFWQLPARVSEDASRQGMAAIENDLMNVAFGDNRTGNLRSIVDAARRTAWLVRERLANDLWRILNRVEALLIPPHGEDQIRSIHAIERLNEIVFLLSAFSGLSNENMTRGIGWRFLDMGRRIERAMNAVALLRCCLLERVEREGPCLEAVLDLGDSLITYRSRYRATLQIAPVLDLLLVDETNPRSVAYQLHALGAHLNYLQGNRSTPVLSDEQRTVLEATTTLRLIDVHQLGEANERHVRERLDTLLEHLAVDISSLSDIITRAYFSHTHPTRQLNPLHAAYGA